MSDRTKEAYMRKQSAELRTLDARIRELELEAQVAAAEIRREVEQRIDEAKRKRAEINDRLEHIAGTGSNAWKDIKRVIESSKRDIRRIVRRSMSQMEKK